MQQFLQDNLRFLSILLVWSIIWKGLALWRAARQEEKVWFVLLLVVNTCGILEMIYLFLITKGHGGFIKEK
jgi:hypothetical protein